MLTMNGNMDMSMQQPVDFTDAKRMLGASPALLQGKILRGGMGTLIVQLWRHVPSVVKSMAIKPE